MPNLCGPTIARSLLARALLRTLVTGLLAAAVLIGAPRAAVAAEVPAVAAAADLRYALEKVAQRFEARTGQAVRLTFGSSGNFYRQLRQGAPFEIFLSADEAYVLELHAAGLTRDRGALYAIGRVVLFVPEGSRLRPDPTLDDLAAATTDGRLRRFVIANPEHAPYGTIARQVLRQRGLWAAIKARLALGENAAQAMQFTLSGAVDGGIVPYSLAIVPAIAARGRFALIPEERHAALRQRMVLLKDAGPTAEAFFGFIASPEARRELANHGFDLPR